FARNYGYDPLFDLRTNSLPENPDALLLPPFASALGNFDASKLARDVDGFARDRDSLADATRTLLHVRLPNSAVPVAVPAELQYDGKGRLVRITRADDVVIDYEYLPEGFCCYRKVSGPPNLCVPAERIFVWDGGRLLEE